MESFAFEEMKDVAVGAYKLKFCSSWDADCSDIVGVVIVENEDISITAGGRNKKGACLVGGDAAGRLKTKSVDMVGLGWIGLNGVVDEMRCGITAIGRA